MVCVVAGGSPRFYRSTIIHIFIFSDEKKTYILASRVCITYKCPCCCVFHALAHSTHLRFCLCLLLAFIYRYPGFFPIFLSVALQIILCWFCFFFLCLHCCNSPSDMTALSHVWSIFDLQSGPSAFRLEGLLYNPNNMIGKDQYNINDLLCIISTTNNS